MSNISPEKLTELNALLSDVKMAIYYMEDLAFISQLMYQVNFVFTDAYDKPACTNGTTVYIHPDIFENLCDTDRVFLIAHELWHIALSHSVRINDHDLTLFNKAADYVVNGILMLNGIEPVDEGLLQDHNWTYDSDYDDMSTE